VEHGGEPVLSTVDKPPRRGSLVAGVLTYGASGAAGLATLATRRDDMLGGWDAVGVALISAAVVGAITLAYGYVRTERAYAEGLGLLKVLTSTPFPPESGAGRELVAHALRVRGDLVDAGHESLVAELDRALGHVIGGKRP
jgi:hypothetical protein